jgi:hypothetical protein
MDKRQTKRESPVRNNIQLVQTETNTESGPASLSLSLSLSHTHTHTHKLSPSTGVHKLDTLWRQNITWTCTSCTVTTLLFSLKNCTRFASVDDRVQCGKNRTMAKRQKDTAEVCQSQLHFLLLLKSREFRLYEETLVHREKTTVPQ